MALVLLFWWDEPPSLLFWSPEYIPGNWPIAIRSHNLQWFFGGPKNVNMSHGRRWWKSKPKRRTWPLGSPSAMLAALLRGVPNSSDMFQLEFPDSAIQVWNHTVDGCENLQHRKDGWNPINHGINHLSAGAGFRNHPQYGFFDRSQAKSQRVFLWIQPNVKNCKISVFESCHLHVHDSQIRSN